MNKPKKPNAFHIILILACIVNIGATTFIIANKDVCTEHQNTSSEKDFDISYDDFTQIYSSNPDGSYERGEIKINKIPNKPIKITKNGKPVELDIWTYRQPSGGTYSIISQKGD